MVAPWPTTGSTPWGTPLRRYTDASVFESVRNMLTDGNSVALGFLTDSTGNDSSTEYIALMCDRLHALWPNNRVEFNGYDNTAPNNFTGALKVIKYAGATTERKVAFVGTANSGLTWNVTSANAVTGDLDIRAKVAATTWGTGAERVMVAKFGVGGTRSYYFYIDATTVGLTYSADGTTLQTATMAQGSFTLVNGTATYLRATLTLNNGAGGHDVKFYQSIDNGVTYVQKGATVTVAGVMASLFSDNVTTLEIAGRGSSGAGNWVGDIYRVEIRSGIDGAIVAPTLPDLWNPNTTSFDGVFSGDPVIQVWAAAASGWGIGNFVTNSARMVPAAGQMLQLVATSHNDVYLRDANLWQQWDTVLAAVRSRAPGAGIVVTNQNPQIAPRTAQLIAAHGIRCRMLEAYAVSRGYEFVDVYAAFLNSGVALSTLVSATDGEHPSVPQGMALWALALQTRWGIAP